MYYRYILSPITQFVFGIWLCLLHKYIYIYIYLLGQVLNGLKVNSPVKPSLLFIFTDFYFVAEFACHQMCHFLAGSGVHFTSIKEAPKPQISPSVQEKWWLWWKLQFGIFLHEWNDFQLIWFLSKHFTGLWFLLKFFVAMLFHHVLMCHVFIWYPCTSSTKCTHFINCWLFTCGLHNCVVYLMLHLRLPVLCSKRLFAIWTS